MRADTIEIGAEISDPAIVRALKDLRPGRGPARAGVSITTARQTGLTEVTHVITDQRSTMRCRVEIRARVAWGVPGAAAPDDVTVERLLRVALMGASDPDPPAQRAAPAPDLLAPLAGLDLPHVSYEAAATLLLAEWLGRWGSSVRVERFALGPQRFEGRHVELVYRTVRDAAAEPSPLRAIEGIRRLR